MLNAGYDVDKSIENIVGRKPDNISMKQKVSFVREFEEGDALFNNRYFSSLLMAYGKKEKFIKQENRSIIRRTILSILQLQLVLYPLSNSSLFLLKILLYSIKNGIGGCRYATLRCYTNQ